MQTYEQMKAHIDYVIARERDALFALNGWIFDKHEVSCREFETSARVVDFLRSKGFTVEYPFYGIPTAFFAARPGAAPHRRKIAILTEYDALPDVGHACGHCLSCCISLLAGLSLAELQDELDADIHIIGTPGEETEGAKVAMADGGLFNDYDMAIMVHLNNYNLVEPDVQAITPLLYHFHGKAAHAAAAPWEGRNAFNAGQLFFHALDMMRQHITPECRIHGIFRNSGAAANIVPDEVSAAVYVRSMDNHTQTDLLRRVDDCARGAAIATQCTWDKEYFEPPYLPLKKNPTGAAVLREIYEELGLSLDAPTNRFGSTDAGNVSLVCPTFHPCLETVPHEIAIHQREFAAYMTTDWAYQSLQTGAKIIAYHCARIFSDGELFRRMKEDFNR